MAHSFKAKRWLLPVAVVANVLLAIAPASANCADSVGSVESFQRYMTRHWQALQQQTAYPWGTARPYASLSGEIMTLTPEFDRMTPEQKQQVILEALRFPPFDQLTPEEQADWMNSGGAMSPYRIYASDGRLVSAAYDGCTRPILLTERDRYSWYYNTMGRGAPQDLTVEGLRNAGRPSWRVVNHSISAEQERTTRLAFWRAIGWDASDWWIAWVPETGYFEINVPRDYNEGQLDQFWRVAPRQYRYTVVANDGSLLYQYRF